MFNNLAGYQEFFGLKNATFLRIEHEDALVADVYKILLPHGKTYILKTCARQSDYLCEVYFLNYFADQLPVPHILEVVEPSAKINGAILMEYLEGDLLKAENVTEYLAYEMGSLLAKIHSNKTAGYGDLTQPHTLSNNPSFYFTYKFEESLSECRGHLPESLLERCRKYYALHISLLNSADGPCITHRDFRPGNIIVNRGKVEGIIDWSSARGSFAEEDLCYLALGEPFVGKSYKENFLSGYDSIRRVPDYEHLLSLLHFSRAIAIIGFTVKSGTWQDKNACLYKKSCQSLATFLDCSIEM